MVYDVPLALQHEADTAIAEPLAQTGDLAHSLADHSMVRRAFSPDHLRIDADQHAGPALRNLMIPHPVAGLASSDSSQQILQDRVVQHTLGQEPLELAVLILELP